MPNTPTPGQVNYEAWWTAFGDGQQDLRFGEPWACLTVRQRRAWEAAAQAVLDQTKEEQDELLTLINEARAYFEDAFAGLLEYIELRQHGSVTLVLARVNSDDLSRLNNCLRTFDKTWWVANCHRSRGLLVFDYEMLSPIQEKGSC